MGITKTQRNLLLAVAIGLLVYFLVPAANGLTPQGVRMLAVFIPVIFVWLIEGGSGWSALFAATMMVLIGAYNGAHTYELLWGGSMVAMIIPFYMISNAMEESGAMMWVVRWILSRKVVHGRPTLFTILFVVSMVLSSVLINTMVIVVIFFKILRDITDSIGLDKDSEFFHAHGLLIGWIAQIADGCLIWGRPFILSMVGIIIGLGFRNFTMNDFFKLSGMYLLFACVVGIALIKFWVRPDTSAFEKFDDAAIREDLKANPMSKRAKTLLGGMVLAIVAYVCAFLTPLGSIQTYFNGLPVAAPISIIVATLCVITVDGKPAIDLGKEMGRLPWNTIMFLGSVMYFGGIIGSADFGISTMLSNVVTPIVASIPASVVILIGLAIASVLTNLTSNAVSATIVLSCFIPAMLAAPNISNSQVLAFAACVVMVCATAIGTLAACATMSLVYCPEGIEYKRSAKYSLSVCAVMVLIGAFILVPLGSGFFAGIV